MIHIRALSPQIEALEATPGVLNLDLLGQRRLGQRIIQRAVAAGPGRGA
jgi:hypothetical protein